MDHLFLDANILYSAALLRSSSFRLLWEFDDVELLTSEYVRNEAYRNLLKDRPDKVPELMRLLEAVSITTEALAQEHNASILLPEKDRPILSSAIKSGATHLLTGDKRHFGQFYGQRIADILVLSPAEYLRSRAK